MLLQYHEISKIDTNDKTVFYVCIVFESVVLILGVFSYFMVSIHIRNYQVHFNFKAIVIYSMLGYLIDMIFRLITILYETGILEYDKTQLSMANDTKTLLDNQNYPDIPIIIIISSLYRVYYIAEICSVALMIAIERYFATIWVADYEQKERKWLGIPMLMTNFIFGASGSVIFQFELIDSYVLLITSVILNFISIFAFVCLYFMNRRNLKNIPERNGPNQYTLSFRFQLNENLKIMKIIKYALVLVAVVNTIISIFFIISNNPFLLKNNIYLVSISSTCFNCTIAVYGQIVIFVIVLSEKSIRKYFLRNKLIRSLTYPLFSKCFPQDYQKKKIFTVNEETTLHFNSLASQWDNRIRPDEQSKKEEPEPVKKPRRKRRKRSRTKKILKLFLGKKQSRVDISTSIHSD